MKCASALWRDARSREFLMKRCLLFPYLSGVVAGKPMTPCTPRIPYSAVWAGFPQRYRPIPVLSAYRMVPCAGAKRRRRYRFFSDVSDYAANIEPYSYRAAKRRRAAATQEMTLVDTPNAKTIAELVEQFNLPIEKNGKNAAGESG